MLTIKTIFPIKENVCTTREVVEEEDREDQSGQVNIQMSGGGSFHLQVYKDWTSHHQSPPVTTRDVHLVLLRQQSSRKKEL